MSANDLLLWMSARQEGSWQQFKDAVEELLSEAESADSGRSKLPLHQRLRFSLERLGHVEFSSVENYRWRVVPPVLALGSNCDAAGVVCGARSPETVNRLRALPGIQVDMTANDEAPDTIVLRGTTKATLLAAVQRLGFMAQDSTPLSILAALPSVRDRSTWKATEIPTTPGWTIHRFSVSQRRWQEALSEDPATNRRYGLFRFVKNYQHFYYVVTKEGCFHVPVQVAKYALMRRRRGVLRYEPQTLRLEVVPIFRPPLLVDRALVLCSGALPTVNATGCLEYPEVPPEVAALSANILNQELR